MNEFQALMPEIILLTFTLGVLLADLFINDKQRWIIHAASQAGLLIAAITLWFTRVGEPALFYGDSFIRDPMGDTLKLFILGFSMVVLEYSRQYLVDKKLFKGEYYLLVLLSILGMLIMVSSANLLNIYLGLELLSLAMYALVAFSRDSKSATEAAMKYYVLGAIASGMLLYGMSLMYGLTGSLQIDDISTRIAQALSAEDYSDTAIVFALVFVVIGIAFKFGAVPFHMWTPDVYQGAPTSVVLLISSVPKLAAFAMLMRLLAGSLLSLSDEWADMLAILAAASLVLGNLIAIAQTNIKRMLAYSTIAHIGFILLGAVAANTAGYAASMFYTIVYVITSMGMFGALLYLSGRDQEIQSLSDLKGLAKRSPWLAFLMLLLIASMIGIPGTAGFVAKLSVLQAVVSDGRIYLSLLAVVMSVIAAFYYLRVLWFMFFEPSEDDVALPQRPRSTALLLSANSLALLVLGIFPSLLIGVLVIN